MLLQGVKTLASSLNPFQQNKNKQNNSREEFWALNDINFEIIKGDKVPFTLLMILSRITEPTTSKIHINIGIILK